MQDARVILDQRKMNLTLRRFALVLIENHGDFENTALIGLQPRGIWLSRRLHKELMLISPEIKIPYGELDVTFYRDDFGRKKEVLLPEQTRMDFSVEGMKIVLIDDVLYTGRTIRSALDALLDFGRPKKMELLTLIDRRFSRQLPIQPDYVGYIVDAVAEEKVVVKWKEQEEKEDQVVLYRKKLV